MQRSTRNVRSMATVALVGGVALSTGVFASTATRGGTAASPSAVGVEQAVANSLEGVQVDVWDGGAPSPGRTTTMLVHHGDRALELYWTTQGWCVARDYAWRLDHVWSTNSFDVTYTVVQQDTDCMAADGDTVRYRVADGEVVDGRTTWTGMYMATEQWSTRTSCTARWDDPSPCGFADAGALIASAWSAAGS